MLLNVFYDVGIDFFWLDFQKSQHKILDVLFSGLSCVVSVPFYTGFLPLLFWVLSETLRNIESFFIKNN